MKMKKPVVIIGGGGHASVIAEIIQLNKGSIYGYTDLKQTGFACKYLGTDDIVDKLNPAKIQLVLGVGSTNTPLLREKIFNRFKALGFSFAPLVHPDAIISKTAKLKEGVQVMAGAVINPGVQLGENVIINTSSSIDHDCIIHAHSHIAPGSRLSGGVLVGRLCHIGTGGIIIQGVRLADKVTVAAGAVVTRDIPSGQTVAGIPAQALNKGSYKNGKRK